jgi:hypothetical protein
MEIGQTVIGKEPMFGNATGTVVGIGQGVEKGLAHVMFNTGRRKILLTVHKDEIKPIRKNKLKEVIA